jgi:hypothetical protein
MSAAVIVPFRFSLESPMPAGCLHGAVAGGILLGITPDITVCSARVRAVS